MIYKNELHRQIELLINEAIKEDAAHNDITTKLLIKDNANLEAKIISQEKGILAGIDIACSAYKKLDPKINFNKLKNDGDTIKDGDVIAIVKGKTKSILGGERIALNFLQHLSGIATLTNKHVAQTLGFKAKILDTRKTLPGWRYIEKYAVLIGGGSNHRLNLEDMILIKDNHIKANNGVSNALSLINKKNKVKIEVEAESLNEVKECLNFNIDIIMLDNMNIANIKKAVKLINGKCKIEVSGNVKLKNIRAIAKCGIDYISVGKITSSAPSLDIHMEF